MPEEKSLPKPLTDLPTPEKDLPLPEKELPVGDSQPTLNEPAPNEPVPERIANETAENQPAVVAKADNSHRSSIILKSFLLGIIFVILLVIISVVFVFGKNSGSENNQAVVTAVNTPTPTPDPTADWKTYENSEYGYQIKYPEITNGGEWIHEEFSDVPEGILASTGFGPLESKSGGYRWNVSIHSDNSEDIIKSIGDQFPDRKETRKNISLNGQDTILVTVTTNQFEDWISKSIIFERDDFVYVISNGAIDDPNFENFYKSFKFIDANKQTPSPTLNPTSAWKSYSDVNFPFSIKYPTDWRLRTTYGKSVNNTNNYRVAGIDISKNLTSGSTVIINVIDPQGLSFYDWMKGYSGYGNQVAAEPNFKYNDHDAYKFTGEGTAGRNNDAIFYEQDDKIIYLGWNNFDYDQEIADEIMNSLKFN